MVLREWAELVVMVSRGWVLREGVELVAGQREWTEFVAVVLRGWVEFVAMAISSELVVVSVLIGGGSCSSSDVSTSPFPGSRTPHTAQLVIFVMR